MTETFLATVPVSDQVAEDVKPTIRKSGEGWHLKFLYPNFMGHGNYVFERVYDSWTSAIEKLRDAYLMGVVL